MKTKAITIASIALLVAASFFIVRAIWDTCEIISAVRNRTGFVIIEPWWFISRFETTVEAFYSALVLRRLIRSRPILPVVLPGVIVFAVGIMLYIYLLLPWFFFATLAVHFTILVSLLARDCLQLFRAYSETLSPETRNA